jgi:hypothetical protein
MECSIELPQSRSDGSAFGCAYTVSRARLLGQIGSNRLRVFSINFAFASIDPATYQVVTMDSSTSSSLFTDTANLKSIKQDLKIFISIGGW